MMGRMKFGASNTPTGKMFILYLSQVFLLIPRNLPLLVLMKGHLSGCSALVPHWRRSQYKVLVGTAAFLGVIFLPWKKVTKSFPSSNIVMSNHCFLSTLGKIVKFLIHLFGGKGVPGGGEYLSLISHLEAFFQSRLLAHGIHVSEHL